MSEAWVKAREDFGIRGDADGTEAEQMTTDRNGQERTGTDRNGPADPAGALKAGAMDQAEEQEGAYFGPLPEWAKDEETGFLVDDDQKADWCLRKIREANEERERWKRFYEEAMARVNASCDSTIAFMEGKLWDYFGMIPHKESKTQSSYQLPGGKLVYKHQAPEFEREDDALIPWLKENGRGGFVKVKESLDWAGLKKTLKVAEGGDAPVMVTEDGEIVPGITVTKRPDIFKVEVK